MGHKYWGFTVYRCTYGDDLAWEQLMTKLHRCARESLEDSGMEDLIEFLDIPVHEDADLEGASKDVVRRRFKTWLATEAHRERLHADARIIDVGGRGTTPRYIFCLHVDEEALRSVIPVHQDNSLSDETYDTGGFLNLIDVNWALPSEEEAEELHREHEVEDPYDEGFEAVDGCRMQDVGWMRVAFRSVMPGLYAEVLHGHWEFNYHASTRSSHVANAAFCLNAGMWHLDVESAGLHYSHISCVHQHRRREKAYRVTALYAERLGPTHRQALREANAASIPRRKSRAALPSVTHWPVMAGTGTPALPGSLPSRYFLLNIGEGVVYVPTKDEHDANINLIGKKLNFITEYWMMDTQFPRIMRELESEEDLLSSTTPVLPPIEGEAATTYKLRGSTRNGLYVLADEGKPPPTREQRDPNDVDLTICRQYLLDNGERVLYAGGAIWMQRMFQDADLVGKVVDFHPISGAQMITPRIVRELKGSEKSIVLSKDGPTRSEPTMPYIVFGQPDKRLVTRHYTSPDEMAKSHVRRTADGNAGVERYYEAISKHPDISTCREFLLHNGHRVIYVPRTTGIAKANKNKRFDNVGIFWNPDRNYTGEKRAFIVREVEANEKSTVVSPDGPSNDLPTAPYILAGSYNGGHFHTGLYTLPPRLPAQPLASPAPGVSPPSPLGHADTGRLFPVVSVTSIGAEFKDRLLQANMDHTDTPSFLVLVESLSGKYQDESFPGDSITNTSSSFQNQSPHECALLLRRLRQETGSDVNFEYFVILDAKSLKDDTVLMVEAIRADEDDSEGEATAEEEDNPQALRILTLRAEMQLVNSQLLFYDVEGTMREVIERLEEEGIEDGVLRE
ncbi:hypothetical protein LTR17_008579 [Elasticomyces elasticus]|nr:hypothetical protein LTR17_008579 [Elasticomyces elasticus]